MATMLDVSRRRAYQNLHLTSAEWDGAGKHAPESVYGDAETGLSPQPAGCDRWRIAPATASVWSSLRLTASILAVCCAGRRAGGIS